jgi:regulator of replication initiation timing
MLDSLLAENRKLQQENQQLTKRLKRAEALLEVQKKSSKLLGIVLNRIKRD